MKVLTSFLVIIVAIFAVLFLAKDAIAKFAIEKGTTAVTGLELTMDKFTLGLSDSLVQIKGLELKNPEGFEEKNMVDLPEVFVQVDIPSFFKSKAHIKELRLDLAEFAVIKNKDGKLNLDALTGVNADGKKTSKEVKKEKEAQKVDLQIDALQLKIGKVIYKDHSSLLGKATSKTFNINLNERFENITDPQALVKIIVSKVLKNTTIGQLANIDMGQFADVSKLADSGKALIGDAKGQAEDLLKKATDAKLSEVKSLTTDKLEDSKDAASKTLANATDSAKDAAESLTGAAENLFGSMKAKAQE